AKANLKAVEIEAADKNHQYKLYQRVKDVRAISQDLLNQRKYAAQLTQAQLMKAKSNLNALETVFELHTVKAPIDGKILRINTHVGEFAQTGQTKRPILIIGDIASYHVRVEVDETEASRIHAGAPAVGYFRGKGDVPIRLKFVRIEPFVEPKRN